MDKTIDKNITLNFIDKLYSNLQETGKKNNQTLTFLIILCISIILCQLHCITISNNIPILGIKFSISNNYLSLVLCFIFYLIQLYMIELNNKESEIAKNLKNLYNEIGFKHPSLNNRSTDILTFPTLSSITFSKVNDKKNKFASFVRMTKKITKALFIAAISPMCIFYPLYHFYASGSFFTSILSTILLILCSINFITIASTTKAN